MKKLFAIILFVLSISICASANETKYTYNGFYGLFEELCESTVTDFNAVVPLEDANKIIKVLFKEKPFKNDKITNAELAGYLKEKCGEAKAAAPLAFHDAGLLNKDLRKIYSVLNGNEKIYSNDGFLNPDDELTYDYLIGTLSRFENEILKSLSLNTVKGSIISVSLEKGVTSVKLNTELGITDIKFKNMEETKVYKDGVTAPYSRNLERGDVITAYTDASSNGIYIKVTNESFEGFEKFSDKYKLYKGYVYYIDHGKAIIKDLYEFNGYEYTDFTPDTYWEFEFDENTLLESNFKPTYIDYINENLLDKPIYIICDNNRLFKAKYFNIAE